jgi:two-component system response regulator AtoC
MAPVVAAIDKVARTSASVLLLGETGTGKEVAARAIHAKRERRRARPFLAVNGAALAENLLESELFGHERGAFTGAVERRRGKIELADGGSSSSTRSASSSSSCRPSSCACCRSGASSGSAAPAASTSTCGGSRRPTAISGDDDATGRFREDLYHRLAVFPIRLPPLRERKGDLVPAGPRAAGADRTQRARPGADARRRRRGALVAWHWPGNVRELANTLERAAILAERDVIGAGDIWLEAGGRRRSQRRSRRRAPVAGRWSSSSATRSSPR